MRASGGAKRAELFRQALQRRIGRPVGSAYMEKYRANDVVTGALLVGGKAGSLREGAALAAELIDSGAALRKLDQLVAASNRIAEAESR